MNGELICVKGTKEIKVQFLCSLLHIFISIHGLFHWERVSYSFFKCSLGVLRGINRESPPSQVPGQEVNSRKEKDIWLTSRPGTCWWWDSRMKIPQDDSSWVFYTAVSTLRVKNCLSIWGTFTLEARNLLEEGKDGWNWLDYNSKSRRHK